MQSVYLITLLTKIINKTANKDITNKMLKKVGKSTAHQDTDKTEVNFKINNTICAINNING